MSSSSFSEAQKNFALSYGPDAICCRQSQANAIRQTLTNVIGSPSGCLMYLSGIPGTGKSALVSKVLSDLPKNNNSLKIAEINCMHFAGVELIIELLKIFGDFVPNASNSRLNLTNYLALMNQLFSNIAKQTPEKKCILVLDEVDVFLGGAKTILKGANRSIGRKVIDSIAYAALNLKSSLCLITISNDVNLTKAFLAGHRRRIVSINFPPYNWEELIQIAIHRLQNCSTATNDGEATCLGFSDEVKQQNDAKLLDNNALEYLAKKAATSGDARRMLEFCRAALASKREPFVGCPLLITADPSSDAATKTVVLPVPSTPPTRKRKAETPSPTQSKKKNTPTPKRARGQRSPSDSADLPMLAPDTPPQTDCPVVQLFEPVTLPEAAMAVSGHIYSNIPTLKALPFRQKLMIISATNMKGSFSVGQMIESFKSLCSEKRLGFPGETEVFEIIDGLTCSGLLTLQRVRKHGGAHVHVRMSRVVRVVTVEDLNYAFSDDMILLDAIAFNGQ